MRLAWDLRWLVKQTINRVISGKLFIAGKNFTQPPFAPVAPNINSYRQYHCLRSEGQRLAWDSRWLGEASLRRWRSVEATLYSLSCSSLLSAWPGARSLRWLVVVVVSKLKSKSLWSQIYTAHSIVTSILTSMFIGVSIEAQTNYKSV